MRAREPHEPLHERTSELLARIAAEQDGATIGFGELIDRFGRRAFALLLVIAVVPAFIPSPVGAGAISGPLLAFAGVQILIGREHPWLPRWLRDKRIERTAIANFNARFGRFLSGLERMCRVRWPFTLEGHGFRITGLLIIGHGIALALPIPLTNYPFGFVLLLVAIAMLEGDGLILAIGWALMSACIALVIGVSDLVWRTMSQWLG
jgi:hypothetical protein